MKQMTDSDKVQKKEPSAISYLARFLGRIIQEILSFAAMASVCAAIGAVIGGLCGGLIGAIVGGPAGAASGAYLGAANGALRGVGALLGFMLLGGAILGYQSIFGSKNTDDEAPVGTEAKDHNLFGPDGLDLDMADDRVLHYHKDCKFGKAGDPVTVPLRVVNPDAELRRRTTAAPA